MRLVKTIGLTALAALAAMAFIGASSATAEVVLCKAKEEPCAAANRFPAGTTLDGSLVAGTEAELLAEAGTVKCSSSSTGGTTETESGEPLMGEITSLSFSGCTLGSTKCTTTTEHLNYLTLLLLTGEVLPNGEEHYHLVVHEKGTNGAPQVLVECGSLVKCKFGAPAAGALFLLLKEPTDTVGVILQELTRTGGVGFTCGNASIWHASYLIDRVEGTKTSPAGAWPAEKVAEDVVLCGKDVKGGECPEANRFPTGAKLDAELAGGTESLLLTSLGNVKCTGSQASGETSTSSESALESKIESMSFSGCTLGETSCTVTPEHLAYHLQLLPAEGEAFHTILEEAGKGKPQFKVVCGSTISCTFGNAETLFAVELGESDSSLKVAQELQRTGSTCPKTSKWEATYLLRALEGGVKVGTWPGIAKIPLNTYLCKKDVKGGNCAEEDRFATGALLETELVSGTESLLLTSLGTVKCTSSQMSGKTTGSVEATLEGKIESLSLTGCTLGETKCTVTPEHLSYRLLLLQTEGEAFHVLVEELEKVGKPQFKVTCGSTISCVFGDAETLFAVELGEKDSSLKVSQELHREGSTCPKTSKWEATYLLRAFTEPVLISVWPAMKS